MVRVTPIEASDSATQTTSTSWPATPSPISLKGREPAMHLLLDTHLLVWAMGSPQRLPEGLREMLEDPANTPVFSVASLW